LFFQWRRAANQAIDTGFSPFWPFSSLSSSTLDPQRFDRKRVAQIFFPPSLRSYVELRTAYNPHSRERQGFHKHVYDHNYTTAYCDCLIKITLLKRTLFFLFFEAWLFPVVLFLPPSTSDEGPRRKRGAGSGFLPPPNLTMYDTIPNMRPYTFLPFLHSFNVWWLPFSSPYVCVQTNYIVSSSFILFSSPHHTNPVRILSTTHMNWYVQQSLYTFFPKSKYFSFLSLISQPPTFTCFLLRYVSRLWFLKSRFCCPSILHLLVLGLLEGEWDGRGRHAVWDVGWWFRMRPFYLSRWTFNDSVSYRMAGVQGWKICWWNT